MNIKNQLLPTFIVLSMLGAITANATDRQFDCKNDVSGNGSLLITVPAHANFVSCDVALASGVETHTGKLKFVGFQESEMIYQGTLTSTADNQLVEAELFFPETMIQAEAGTGRGTANLNSVRYDCSERLGVNP